MGRTKPKTCPDCSQIVSSQCVICVCGGSVKSSRANPSTDQNHLKRRRTERTKRVKPDFYNALEYDKPPKPETKRRGPKVAKAAEIISRRPLTPPPPNRMHLTVTKKIPETKEDHEIKEEELEEIKLSEETIAKFSLILDDINRKICESSWQSYVK